jgi:glucose-1-phosphate cytidylyltransferase
MKVIILAGGWGTRLGRLTELIPKPMALIGSFPIVWHIMKIYAHYGYKDFIISAGVKIHLIKDFFLFYESYTRDVTRDFVTGKIEYENEQDKIDWRVTVADTGLNTLKGARIKRIEKYLTDDENMVTYGDGVANINIEKLVDFHKSHGKTITITGVHPPARFGEINEIDGKAISFEEKPQASVGLINGGFMVFNRKLLDYLSEDEGCDLEFGPLASLAKQGEVMVYRHDGSWECVDHERDLDHLNSLWNKGQAFWKMW